METIEMTKTSLLSPTLGEIQYEEDQVVIFPSGLIGFEELTSFVLYENEDFKPFICLVSIEEPVIYFPLLDPRLIDTEYGSENMLSELKGLGMSSLKDALILAVVTIGNDFSQVTVNLRGPLVINAKRMLGEQIILVDSKYMVKHPVQFVKN